MTDSVKKVIKRGSRSIRAAVMLGFADYLGYPRWATRTRFGNQPPKYRDLPEKVGAKEYSRTSFARYRPLERVRWPLLLLASVPGQVDGKLLVIGPRFESEFYLARGLGWHRKSLAGLDLLSYSPYVTVGDMHQMPFSDGEFKSVVCGWTISYSHQPNLAAQEMSRVLMPGGILVFGVEVSLDDSASNLDVPKGEARIQTRLQFEKLLPSFECIACFAPAENGNLIIAMKKPLR